ncbi:MAG: LPP20 family lipoprotein [Candidatus Paceibacterota bacterium]
MNVKLQLHIEKQRVLMIRSGSITNFWVLVLWVSFALGGIQALQAQQKPTWLDNYPADSRYYIGIGGTVKTQTQPDTDYQKRAVDNALGDLISQIEVNVSNETLVLEQELNGEVSDFFRSLTQTQARNVIEGYEIVDTWAGDAEYWVYLRLSKQQYEARLQQKVDLAQQQAYSTFKNGDAAFDAGNYLLALDLYTKGIADLIPYVDRIREISHQGRSINLFAELRTKIQTALNELRFTDASGPEMTQIGKAATTPFTLSVVTTAGKLVERVPVEFVFVRGAGEINGPVHTNSQGVATARLAKVLATDKLQIVKAQVTLGTFLTPEQQNSFTQAILDGFNSPSVEYMLRVSRVPVYMEHYEIFLGEQKISDYIEPVLKNTLTEAGYTYVDHAGEAEFFIEVEAATHKGSETHGLYTAFLDYHISVTSLTTGKEIAAYAINNIKGVSDTYQKAAEKALQAGADSLQTNLVARLVQRLQN